MPLVQDMLVLRGLQARAGSNPAGRLATRV